MYLYEWVWRVGGSCVRGENGSPVMQEVCMYVLMGVEGGEFMCKGRDRFPSHAGGGVYVCTYGGGDWGGKMYEVDSRKRWRFHWGGGKSL